MISLCITTHQRTSLLFESFQQVIDDDRISEIVIVDDCSSQEVWNELVLFCSQNSKIQLYRNEKNLDCYRNKREAVSKASNEWVIIFDSDNIITKSYLDALGLGLQSQPEYDKKTVYQPSFAKPNFDFRHYSRTIISKFCGGSILTDDSVYLTMLNAMNYFVNRDEYLRVWDGSVDPVTSDSLYQNYRWLEAGNSIYVVPGLEYEHRVHDGSHFKQNVRRTPRGFHDSIINKMRQW